jgi:hypothetical protein
MLLEYKTLGFPDSTLVEISCCGVASVGLNFIIFGDDFSITFSFC